MVVVVVTIIIQAHGRDELDGVGEVGVGVAVPGRLRAAEVLKIADYVP